MQYVSPLPSGIVETKLHPLTLSYDEVQKKLDALIDKTAGDVAAVPNPPRSLLGSETSASYVNRRNGLYVFSVAAVDEVGNIGPAAKTTILLDKYVPSTYITTINTVTDEFGTVTLSLYGGGYTYDGTITTIYIDKDGKAPYDRVLTMAGGGYRVVSDNRITGISLSDMKSRLKKWKKMLNQRKMKKNKKKC